MRHRAGRRPFLDALVPTESAAPVPHPAGDLASTLRVGGDFRGSATPRGAIARHPRARPPCPPLASPAAIPRGRVPASPPLALLIDGPQPDAFRAGRTERLRVLSSQRRRAPPSCGAPVVPQPPGRIIHEWTDPSVIEESVCRHGVLPDIVGARRHLAADDPDRHPAGVQEPGGAGPDLLRRHVGGRASRRTSATRMERWTGQAGGHRSARSRAPSSGPASSATTTQAGTDPNGALTQVQVARLRPPPSLACRPARSRPSSCPSIRPALDARLPWWRWTWKATDPNNLGEKDALRRGTLRGRAT